MNVALEIIEQLKYPSGGALTRPDIHLINKAPYPLAQTVEQWETLEKKVIRIILGAGLRILIVDQQQRRSRNFWSRWAKDC